MDENKKHFSELWSSIEKINALPDEIRHLPMYFYNGQTKEKETINLKQLLFDDSYSQSVYFEMLNKKMTGDIEVFFTFYKYTKKQLLDGVHSGDYESCMNFLKSIDCDVVFLVRPSEMFMRKECISYIKEKLPEGSTILEFGSGASTHILSKTYNMISIEEDKYWANRYDSDYLLAPIKDDWYDIDMVNNFLKDKSYDAIIIDGPAKGDRKKLVELIENDIIKINKNVMIFVDDVQRSDEYILALKLSTILNRELKVDNMKKIGKDKFLLMGYIKENEND